MKKIAALVIQHAPSEDSDQKAQADLNLRCAHMSKGTFSDVMVHMINTGNAVEICVAEQA